MGKASPRVASRPSRVGTGSALFGNGIAQFHLHAFASADHHGRWGDGAVASFSAYQGKSAKTVEIQMLQRINIDAYFASMVCRDFSESVFGISAETGASILLKQEVGLPSFEGFRKRYKKITTFSNGKTGMLSSMTALEYTGAIKSSNYQHIISNFSDKLEANCWIKSMANEQNMTISNFIMSGSTMVKTGEAQEVQQVEV